MDKLFVRYCSHPDGHAPKDCPDNTERHTLNGGESGDWPECILLTAYGEPGDIIRFDPDETLPAFRTVTEDEINAAIEVLK